MYVARRRECVIVVTSFPSCPRIWREFQRQHVAGRQQFHHEGGTYVAISGCSSLGVGDRRARMMYSSLRISRLSISSPFFRHTICSVLRRFCGFLMKSQDILRSMTFMFVDDGERIGRVEACAELLSCIGEELSKKSGGIVEIEKWAGCQQKNGGEMRTTHLMTFRQVKASRHPQPDGVSGESLTKASRPMILFAVSVGVWGHCGSGVAASGHARCNDSICGYMG